MKDKAIKELIQHKLEELAGLAKKIGKDFDMGAIHDFRTTAKMLRAFLRLLQGHSAHPGARFSKEFKQLYHIAGTIRDAQLELENLHRRHLSLPQYSERIRQIIAAQKLEWEQSYSESVFQDLEEKLCGFEYGTLKPGVLKEFYTGKMASIEELSSIDTPSDIQVHDARKEVKDILYTSKLARKKWDDAGKLVRDLPLDQLDEVSDVIGDYRDGHIIFDHLKAFYSPDIDPAEAAAIEQFCEQEATRLRIEKLSVLHQIREFIKENHI